MTENADIRAPFKEFAQRSGDYYANTFLKIQKSELPTYHINFSALIGSFVWAALRGNWLLFIVGFVLDLIAMVNLSLYYKYSWAIDDPATKGFLIERYQDWSGKYFTAFLIVFILGRLFFAWLADRLYERQYNRWRISRVTNSGFSFSRLLIPGLISLMIIPLMIYRANSFAPSERACDKQLRAIEAGEVISFKNKFDCLVISEFPTLFKFDRPDEITYPRDDDGNRYVLRTPAPEGARQLKLNPYAAQKIDDQVAYLTTFYGSFFDVVKDVIEAMLEAITSVFVGTPWIITMCVLLFVSYILAGTRTAIFVGASFAYLALLGFWQTAMETMSIVMASSMICVLFGIPLGIWVGKSKLGQAIVTPILDVMQTIPSFVYLVPAVAFFGIGKVPGILATVIFAMPPMVRLTALGIKQVPESTKEAALAFGANPRQLLNKVELPLALPSIMAGINQVVMMSLSMVVIAALIGAKGMGGIVVEALNNTEVGSGILSGLGIALLAMMIDRVVQKANKVRH